MPLTFPGSKVIAHYLHHNYISKNMEKTNKPASVVDLLKSILKGNWTKRLLTVYDIVRGLHAMIVMRKKPKLHWIIENATSDHYR